MGQLNSQLVQPHHGAEVGQLRLLVERERGQRGGHVGERGVRARARGRRRVAVEQRREWGRRAKRLVVAAQVDEFVKQILETKKGSIYILG